MVTFTLESLFFPEQSFNLDLWRIVLKRCLSIPIALRDFNKLVKRFKLQYKDGQKKVDYLRVLSMDELIDAPEEIGYLHIPIKQPNSTA